MAPKPPPLFPSTDPPSIQHYFFLSTHERLFFLVRTPLSTAGRHSISSVRPRSNSSCLSLLLPPPLSHHHHLLPSSSPYGASPTPKLQLANPPSLPPSLFPPYPPPPYVGRQPALDSRGGGGGLFSVLRRRKPSQQAKPSSSTTSATTPVHYYPSRRTKRGEKSSLLPSLLPLPGPPLRGQSLAAFSSSSSSSCQFSSPAFLS